MTYLGSKWDIGTLSSVVYAGHQLGLSVHDDVVVKEYLEVLLTLAVNYSRECIDYFFRGDIGAGFDFDYKTKQIKLYIQSNDYYIYDGKFEVYWDDENGVRTKIKDLKIDGHLDRENNNISVFVKNPNPGALIGRKCTVVFKGNIHGFNVGEDPVDNTTAIAACTAYLSASVLYADSHHTISATFDGVQPNVDALSRRAECFAQQLLLSEAYACNFP